MYTIYKLHTTFHATENLQSTLIYEQLHYKVHVRFKMFHSCVANIKY